MQIVAGEAESERLWSLAEDEGIDLRRSYRRTVRRLVLSLRTANFPRAKKQARKSERRLRTIAGALLRDILRKLGETRLERHIDDLEVMETILVQKQGGPDHIYSVHEPDVRRAVNVRDWRLASVLLLKYLE